MAKKIIQGGGSGHLIGEFEGLTEKTRDTDVVINRGSMYRWHLQEVWNHLSRTIEGMETLLVRRAVIWHWAVETLQLQLQQIQVCQIENLWDWY